MDNSEDGGTKKDTSNLIKKTRITGDYSRATYSAEHFRMPSKLGTEFPKYSK